MLFLIRAITTTTITIDNNDHHHILNIDAHTNELVNMYSNKIVSATTMIVAYVYGINNLYPLNG
jgi:hypothetical protein